jgi:superfamily II DNA helicase RecQ
MEEALLEDEEVQPAGGGDGLAITEEQARRNYSEAGGSVEEEDEPIKLEDFVKTMDTSVCCQLEELLSTLELPYSLVPFQHIAIITLGMGRSVILVVPTGSGKMTVPLIAALLLRKTQGVPAGITLVTQPLSALQLEQVGNAICPVAVLSMAGALSCSLEELYRGDYPLLLAHPESYDTPEGQRILEELRRLNLITMVCVDEFHTLLHWQFRSSMLKSSSRLRAFAREGAPCLIMSATATKKEISTVMRGLTLRTEPLLLATNPVMAHIKFSVMVKPPQAYGFDGRGEGKPGLKDLLWRIFFRQWMADREAGIAPKVAIIFAKRLSHLLLVHTWLQKLTGEVSAATAPFCMVHSDLTPPTEKVILENVAKEQYSVIAATTRFMVGINIKRADVIIFLSPFDELAAMVQGGGRGGRRQADGTRRKVQTYLLFNGHSLTSKNTEMDEEVRKMCRSAATSCTRDVLHEYFNLGRKEKGQEGGHDWCCHYHDTVGSS